MTPPPLHPLHLGRPPEILALGVGLHHPGQLDSWCLKDCCCLHLYDYHADLRLDGLAFTLAPGWLSFTPPGAPLRYHFRGPSRHHYALLRPARGPADALMPLVQDLGAAAAPLRTAFGEAVSWWSTTPARAQAQIWELLWRLAQPTAGHQVPDPLLEQALHLIERRLAEPLRVAAIARRLEVSHNTLTRLFRRRLGCTVAGYIAERRLEAAERLLAATGGSYAAVAPAVGLGDGRYLGRLLRRRRVRTAAR